MKNKDKYTLRCHCGGLMPPVSECGGGHVTFRCTRCCYDTEWTIASFQLTERVNIVKQLMEVQELSCGNTEETYHD